MANHGDLFLAESRRYLTSEYMPKIRACLERLSEDDVWWRPNEQSNSIGNMLLHLTGNIRQWIVSGVGGTCDNRQRQQEFDERELKPKAELLEHLARAVGEVDAVLAALGTEVLGERRAIQGRDITVFEAIYHVVEHFSMHTGQITYLTKLRTGDDLGFYQDAGGLAKPSGTFR